MNIIGDVSKHHCILVDDIIDSEERYVRRRSSIAAGAISLMHVFHGVLSGSAVSRILNSLKI